MCKDYPSYDISYNAVMPLSRASTRERYSRIVGVTGEVSRPLLHHSGRRSPRPLHHQNATRRFRLRLPPLPGPAPALRWASNTSQ